MERLQVLVATIGQTDATLADKMNIRCAAVIANQAGREEIVTYRRDCGDCKMITTATRGVGLNRNIALLAADAELLLLADDDMVYCDDMPEAVTRAFHEVPDADVLIFGMDILKGGEITERRRVKKQRLHVWNSMRYGSCRMAIRREAIIREKLSFHQSFGGGCPFSAGEDTLFLKNCFDCGLHVYAYPYVLGTCCKDTSTWFRGYDEKYFYDRGVLVRRLFPRAYPLMVPYFALRFKRMTDVPPLRRLRLMLAGVRGGKKMRPYAEEK